MDLSKPNLDNQLLLCLFVQLFHVSKLQQANKSDTEQMNNATQSLKNLSEAIAVLKMSGIAGIDQESAPVLLDRIAKEIED